MKNALLILVLLFALRSSGAEMPWGGMTASGAYRQLTVKEWPANRLLPLPTPFPNIVSAWIERDGRRPIHWMFSPDASQMALGLPPLNAGMKPPKVHLLTTEKTTEHPDGTIVLSALDAKVIGDRAKLETNPGNHRIGFWTNSRDHVEWSFVTKGKGAYAIEIAYSRSGPAGARLSLEIDDKQVPLTLATTGNWYVYTGQAGGEISIVQAGAHVARVKCVDPVGGAVMNLKAVVLRPRP